MVCAPSKDSDQLWHEESWDLKLSVERTEKTLIRLGRCPGWSESSPGAHPVCWLCQEVARFLLLQLVLVQTLTEQSHICPHVRTSTSPPPVIYHLYEKYSKFLPYTFNILRTLFVLSVEVSKTAGSVTNSVDPDQTPRAAFDQGLHCFPMCVLPEY